MKFIKPLAALPLSALLALFSIGCEDAETASVPTTPAAAAPAAAPEGSIGDRRGSALGKAKQRAEDVTGEIEDHQDDLIRQMEDPWPEPDKRQPE